MLSGGQFSAALTFDLYPGEYPQCGSLLTEAFGGTMQATSTSLNVAFLADFQQAARLNEPNMRIFVRDHKPTASPSGTTSDAAIMPVRYAPEGVEAFAWEGRCSLTRQKPKTRSIVVIAHQASGGVGMSTDDASPRHLARVGDYIE